MATHTLPEIDAQYRELREGAGLLERSERASLEVRGPDAAEFLQGQVTNDVAALGRFEGCYAALLNPKGRIVADMRILCLGEQLVIDSEADAYEPVLRDLRMYKIGRRVEVLDSRAQRTTFSLIGPRSDEITRSALGVLAPAAEHAFAETPDGSLVVRTDLGADVVVAADRAAQVREALLEAGAEPVSLEAAEIARVESGRPRHGQDMSEDNFPAELGIVDRAVSFTKGCYVGQEPVARMHYKGHPNRHLRGLHLSEPATAGAPLQASGKEVGRVTSTALSPSLGPIALALVRREVAPGEQLSVGEQAAGATVVELPFGTS